MTTYDHDKCLWCNQDLPRNPTLDRWGNAFCTRACALDYEKDMLCEDPLGGVEVEP